jgi:hypothetical protein
MSRTIIQGRRRSTSVALLLIVLLPALTSCSRPSQLKSGQCKPGDPLDGVYIASRLTVKNACMTVSGTVDCLKNEPDGDIHIRLRPDSAFQHLLMPANAYQQCSNQADPHLVVEIIPQVGHPPFPGNSANDAGFVSPPEPAPGDHITVTGPYVLDSNALHDLLYPGKDVKDWAEIHPAWNITVDQPAAFPRPLYQTGPPSLADAFFLDSQDGDA